jgi:hypothetical protein
MRASRRQRTFWQSFWAVWQNFWGQHTRRPDTRLQHRRPLARPRLGHLLFERLEAREVLSALVSVDQPDYPPGSTAYIVASNDGGPLTNFSAGETVHFHIDRTDGIAVQAPPAIQDWFVTDGVGDFAPYQDANDDWLYPDTDGAADGSINTSWYVDQQFAGASLELTATGETSAAVAVTDFTDAANSVNVTAATGGSAIPGSTAGGVFTALTGPTLTENTGNGGDIQTGALVLNAPAGFEFNTTATVTILVTGGNASKNINGTANGSTISTTVTSTQITAIITSKSSGGSGGGPNTLTWQNIQVRPTSALSLASGSILASTDLGTALSGVHLSSTNFGTLIEVKADQAISFGALSNQTYGDSDFNVSATATSDLPVSFSIIAGGTYASISGTTIHIIGATPTGQVVTVRAAQAGNATYNAAPTVDQSFIINKANPTIVVTPYSVTYDSNSHTAAGTATGVISDNLAAGLTLSGTAHTAAGTYNGDGWSFHDAAGNYNDASGTVNDSIGQRDLYVTASANSKTYGQTASDTGAISGVQGSDGITASFASAGDAANAPVGTGSYTITGTLADPNNKLANYSVHQTDALLTVAKADATINVTPYSVTYDGNSHTAAYTITGVNGETGAMVGTVTQNTTHTDAGTYASDSWSFTGAANYNNIASTTITDTIAKADPTVNVSGYTCVYDGDPHGATGSVTGVKNESLAGLNLGASFLNVPGGTANWTFTDATGNYNDKTGSVGIVITKATLSGVATTQAALNVAKNGTLAWTVVIDTNNIVDGQSVFQLLNGAIFTLTINGKSYKLQSTATVGLDGTVFVNWTMDAGLKDALDDWTTADNTSASTAAAGLLTVTATTNGGNYTFSDDFLTRLFYSLKK